MDELSKLQKRQRYAEYSRRLRTAAKEMGLELKSNFAMPANTPAEKVQALQEISLQLLREINNG